MSSAGQALVTVMIGVYNAEAYVAEAIESVLAQSYSPIELIVVDDGSDDGSGDVARSYGERLTYIRQERQGNGAARNTAVGAARGDFFAFLDADDLWLPSYLERVVELYDESRARGVPVGIATCDALILGPDGRLSRFGPLSLATLSRNAGEGNNGRAAISLAIGAG